MSKYLILLFFHICSTSVTGQFWDEKLLDQVIKQPDEFLERLNRVSDFPDSVGYYSQLFHMDSVIMAGIPEATIMGFWNVLRADKDSKRSFLDPEWTAWIDCQVLHEGVEHLITLYLILTTDPQVPYRSWRIIGATAPFLKTDSSRVMVITGEDHNMQFFQFGKNLSFDGKNLRGMVHTAHTFDDLTALILLFESGDLQLKSKSLSALVCNDLLGYNLRIEERDLARGLIGWGITSLGENSINR